MGEISLGKSLAPGTWQMSDQDGSTQQQQQQQHGHPPMKPSGLER